LSDQVLRSPRSERLDEMTNLEIPLATEANPSIACAVVTGLESAEPAQAGKARPAVMRIRPTSGWRSLNLVEIWRYRELLWFLAWRDIKLRYKQTALGVAWAVIQPLFTMIVFSILFGQLVKLPSDGTPYPVFVLCALLPWQLFAYALTQSSNSIVAKQRLITKVYFPRLLVPLSSVLSGLADFFVALALLVVFMAYYGVYPGWAIAAIPLFALLAIAAALAVGLWLSALSVQYRDVRYALPFLTQFWMFASPVAYSTSLVPPEWRGWYGLNPMAGVIDGFRWALLGSAECSWSTLAVSTTTVVLLLVGGMFYFRRVECTFADTV
jgi:lipopolysaccharide transport system permease protein